MQEYDFQNRLPCLPMAQDPNSALPDKLKQGAWKCGEMCFSPKSQHSTPHIPGTLSAASLVLSEPLPGGPERVRNEILHAVSLGRRGGCMEWFPWRQLLARELPFPCAPVLITSPALQSAPWILRRTLLRSGQSQISCERLGVRTLRLTPLHAK